MNITPVLLTGILGAACLDATPIIVFSQSGSDSSVDAALDGATVTDHLGLNNYSGFVGELVLIPTDPNRLAGVANGTAGIVVADNKGTFSNLRGLAGFCIDSETSFSVSTSTNQAYSYESYNYLAANARYLQEGVLFYENGGLKRAAYLMETFYAIAHGGTDNDAAALQSAIWEVLYDTSPSVTQGSGDYYINTNAGNNAQQNRSTQVSNTANTWLTQAAGANWGGTTYDPQNRVLFWLDPEATNQNQSIITLNPQNALQPIPESQALGLVTGSLGMLILLRRRY